MEPSTAAAPGEAGSLRLRGAQPSTVRPSSAAPPSDAGASSPPQQAPPPPPPAPPLPAERRQQLGAPASGSGIPTSGLLLHQCIGIVGACAQFILTFTQWEGTDSWYGRLQMLLLTVGLTLLAVFMLVWPRKYWRHRVWVLPVSRIILYSMPILRTVGEGASLMLEREPQPGWKGAIADLARVVAGTRLLGVIVGGATVMLPPAFTLVVQIILAVLIYNNPGYCETQLLRHPLTQQRSAALASALEFCAIPLLGLLVLVGGSTAGADVLLGRAPEDKVCRATLMFLQAALGVIIPTIMSVVCWDPAAQPGAAGDGSDSSNDRAADGQDGGSQQQQRSPARLQEGWARLWNGGQRAAASASRLLHYILSYRAGLDWYMVSWWWLLAVGWWLCRNAAGIF